MNLHHRKLLFFCHGIPGSPRDSELLSLPADVDFVAPNLLALNSRDPLGEAISQFDSAIAQAEGTAIELAGFSLGAMVALRLAARWPGQIRRGHLGSPAAPLSLGDFLPAMAGRPVFELAAARPLLFGVLTAMQGLASRIAPRILMDRLFADSSESEKKLLADAGFQAILRSGLKNSYIDHPAAYRAWLQAYMGDWADEIDDIDCPVELWHGQQDSWAPVSMTHALASRLGTKATTHLVESAGHYVALTEARLRLV